MMDIQKMVDYMNAAMKGARSGYHVTLGELIEACELVDAEVLVMYEDGTSPASPDSYRGYYSDIALAGQTEKKTAGDLLKELREVIDTELTGYNGGEFMMGADTPLWKSPYGECSDLAIVAAFPAAENQLLLAVKEVD